MSMDGNAGIVVIAAVVSVAGVLVGGVAGFMVGIGLRIEDALEVEGEREQVLGVLRRAEEYLECEPTTQWVRVYPLQSDVSWLKMVIEGRLDRGRGKLKGVRREREKRGEAWAGFEQAFGGLCNRD